MTIGKFPFGYGMADHAKFEMIAASGTGQYWLGDGCLGAEIVPCLIIFFGLDVFGAWESARLAVKNREEEKRERSLSELEGRSYSR